jgi:hypothetical protein
MNAAQSAEIVYSLRKKNFNVSAHGTVIGSSSAFRPRLFFVCLQNPLLRIFNGDQHIAYEEKKKDFIHLYRNSRGSCDFEKFFFEEVTHIKTINDSKTYV